MSKKTTRRASGALITVAACLTSAFGVASAANASTIYACVKKHSGAVRIVSSGAKCKRGEQKLSWNTNGVNGAAGKNGATGPQGPAGASGKDGVNGLNGTALAYAHVLATGTLDVAHSKNVSTSSKAAGTGIFCLKTTVPVTIAFGAVDTSASGGQFGALSAVLGGQDETNIVGTFCPAGDNVLAGTFNEEGKNANLGFWIGFD